MSLSTNFSATNQSDANHSVRKKNIDSPEKKESSGSPSKKHRSQPVIRTPEKMKAALPELRLHEMPKSDESIFDNYKSPVGAISLRERSVKSPADTNDWPNSARSPQSPRSARSEYETMSSRRHRIDSPRISRSGQQQAPALVSSSGLTRTKTITQTETSTISATSATDSFRGNTNEPASPTGDASLHTVGRQRVSCPPNTISLHQQTPEQMNDLADLWIQNLLGSLSSTSSDHVSLLTDAKIKSLGRTDGKVAVSSLSPALGSLKISEDKQGKVTLSSLLNSMLANHLGQSVTGKTIRAIQATVMHANPKLAAIRFDDMIDMDDPDEEKKVRQQMADAVADQASACVDVAFGASRTMSDSNLPQALLDFWRLLDARLVKEAAKNPELTAEQVLTARKNLGFDLLITRQLYPFALKTSPGAPGAEAKPARVTSDSALPVLVTTFANKMSDAFFAAWPAFFTHAIASFDA